MNSTYFIINDIKYIITYDNYELKIKKIDNNLLCELNEEEKENINQIISSKSGYIYYSEKVIDIVNKNRSLFLGDNKYANEQLINLLNWVENCIPHEHRQSFYENLSTLKVMHNYSLIDSDYFTVNDTYLSQIKDLDTSIGGYNTKENVIEIRPHGLWQLWKIAQTTDNPREYYYKQYMQTMLHEIVHMASSSFDKNNGTSLSGFDKYPSESIKQQNVGLTEGYTEIISMAGVSGTKDVISPYFIECCILNQLMQVIGIEVLQDSYFGNKGTELLENELCKLINDGRKAFELFRNIEINYQLRSKTDKQNILGNIQLTLLDYLKKKLDILNVMGNYDEIEKVLYYYESFIITPKTLEIMGRNPDEYEDLVNCIIRFKNIKDNYSQKNNYDNKNIVK